MPQHEGSSAADVSGRTEHPRDYDYSKPVLECDVIMKGGVTSGVIYPWAICELAKTYRFQCVGGTSAGAIAAVATAAAEFGRHKGGFRALAELPEWLGEPGVMGSRLFSLFRPDASTRALFRTAVAGLGKHGIWRWVVQALALVAWFWPSAVLGSLLGVWFVWLALRAGGALAWPSAAVGVVVTIVGALVGALVACVWRAVRVLPRHGFGMCRGFSRKHPDEDQLTGWLERLLRESAGTGSEPLTFGMLWRGPDGSGSREKPWLRLEVMTTDVTAGLPAKLPWDGREFFFDPDVWREYFPDAVVRWMEERPPSLDDLGAEERRLHLLQRRQLEPLRPLSDPENLPVVVAARMSLSFPVLICAVPLFSVDRALRSNRAVQDEAREWSKAHPDATDDEIFSAVTGRLVHTKHWFSDGGFCSNFPLHLFDAPLPSRPTFALNLRGFHPDNPSPKTEAEKVFLPKNNRQGQRRWNQDVTEHGAKGLASFIAALGTTMQNWQDNSQLPLSGYRDRIVHLSLSAEEGGLNLNMPRDQVRKLAERGRLGAVELVKQFAGERPGEEPAWGWTNHRWTRYRVAIVELNAWLSRYAVRFNAPSTPDTPGYREVTAPGIAPKAHGYDWPNRETQEAAFKASVDLADFVASWPAPGTDLEVRGPRIRPRLRLAWSPGSASSPAREPDDG